MKYQLLKIYLLDISKFDDYLFENMESMFNICKWKKFHIPAQGKDFYIVLTLEQVKNTRNWEYNKVK